MKATFKAAALLAPLAVGAAFYFPAAVTAGEGNSEGLRLRERAGALIEVGTKRAVAYYVKDANACQVNVIMTEAYADQIPFSIPSVRYSSSLPGGTSTQIATSDGATLALTCASGAKTLSIESRDSVAWAATN